MEYKGTVKIETERLTLRRFAENDAENIFKNRLSNDNVTKFLRWETYRDISGARGYIGFLSEFGRKYVQG